MPPLSVIGRPINWELARQNRRARANQAEPHHCWVKANHVSIKKLGSKPNDATFRAQGNLFLVESVDLKYTYNDSKNDIKYLSSYVQPKLNRRNLRLQISDFKDLVRHDFQMPVVNTEYNINIMVYVFPSLAMEACRAYDKEHNLGQADATLPQVMFVIKCIAQVAEQDHTATSQKHKNMKGLIVAHMYVLFQRMFNVEYTHLMLFPLKLLLNYFKAFLTEGPTMAFEPIDFEFDKEGILLDSVRYQQALAAKIQRRNKKNNNDNNNNNNDNNNNNNNNNATQNNNTNDDNTYVVNEDDDVDAVSGHGSSNNNDDDESSKFDFPKKVTFYLTYARAVEFYRIQVEQGSVDAVPQDDADPGDAVSNLLGNIKVFQTASSAEKKSQGKEKTVNVVVTCPNGFEFVAVSTDFRKTKANPLDMRELKEEDWIRLLLYDFIESYYNGQCDDGARHFGVYSTVFEPLIDKVIGDSFITPLRNLTKEKLIIVMKKMLSERPNNADSSNQPSFRTETNGFNRLVVYDKTDRCLLNTQTLQEKFETDGHDFLQTGDDRLVVGLGMYIGQEISTHNLLSKYVFDQTQRHLEFMNEIMELIKEKQEHIDVARSGDITFSDEQQTAIFMSLMLPYINIAAPGGRGKSEIMTKIFEVLLKLYPNASFVFTSFKNDTVNQMRAKMAAVVPNLADKKVYFRTNDSIRYAHGIYIFDEDENVFKRLEPDFIFVEEAGMSATTHIQSLLKNFNLATTKKIIFFGDGDQLVPIMPGCPFVAMINAFPDATVRLTRNYRTDNAKLNNFLEVIRTKQYPDDFALDNIDYFDNNNDDDYEGGCNFIVCDDLEVGFQKANRSLYVSYGRRLFKILSRMEGRLAYDDIMAVCPYNDMALFMSWCFTHYYFERPLLRRHQRENPPPPANPNPFSLAKAFADNKKRTYADMFNRDLGADDDDDNDNNNNNRTRINVDSNATWETSNDKFMTVEQAASFFAGERSNDGENDNDNNNNNNRRIGRIPAKYVGEDVSITKTNPEDKRIAQGRVAKITHMFDHLRDQKFELEWIVDDEIPRGFMSIKDTSSDVHKGDKRSWARTVVLDGNTPITFRSNAELHMLLRAAKCCTVHQAQGRQGRVLFSIHPMGKLANSAILYTSSSRAQRKCITLTTADVFETMKTTAPPDPVSIQYDLFLSDQNLLIVMKTLREAAEKMFRQYQAIVDAAQFDHDNDNDDGDFFN